MRPPRYRFQPLALQAGPQQGQSQGRRETEAGPATWPGSALGTSLQPPGYTPVPSNIPNPTQQSSRLSQLQSCQAPGNASSNSRSLGSRLGSAPQDPSPYWKTHHSPNSQHPQGQAPRLLSTHRVQELAPDSQGRKAAPQQAGLTGIPGSGAGGCPGHLTHSCLFFFFNFSEC